MLVTVMRSLPGIMTPSIVSNCPDLRPSQTGHKSDLIVGFDLAVGNSAAKELGDVLAVHDDHLALWVRISFTALRARLEISRSRPRTPASRV